MAEERVQRRLAAILAADMVGYSRLMGADEEGTIARQKAHRAELIDPEITSHGGRIVKTMGDGLLVEFGSVVDAVKCAVAVQNGMAIREAEVPEDRCIQYRIGINLGDIVIDGDDILGDGVNVAARLEGLAEAGGVCISDVVHQSVEGKLDLTYADLGAQKVKNIAKPVRAYHVQLAKAPNASSSELTLHDKPSIAVLPFDNMSGDPEQEYFSDGLAEDIITLLAAWRSFPVIARNSSFAFKGQSHDVRQIAKELSARYVIEGSVRKSGNRVRVTAQLIDAETGHHLWADKFDGTLEDIFEIQDELTRRIVASVEPEMEQAELRKAATERAANLSAWDYFLRGRAQAHLMTPDGNTQARDFFEKAITLDADYADAFAGLSFTYQRDIHLEIAEDRQAWEIEALKAARQAVAIDNGSSYAHLALSGAYIWSNQHDLSIAETRTAVELNPSNVQACLALGNRLDIVGKPEEGIPQLEKSLALNPRDPHAHTYYAASRTWKSR
jgi:adenylate cyclase